MADLHSSTERRLLEELRQATEALARTQEALRSEIAEHQKTQVALRQSEKQFRLVTSAINAAIWNWNLSSNEIVWNRGIQEIFGYTADQVGLNSQWLEVRIHPEDRENILESLQATLDRGELYWSREHRYQRADGSYAHVFNRGHVLRDDQGKPVRMIGAMADITPRKQAEAELQRLTAIVESIDAAIISTTPGCLISSWNQGAERLYGYTHAEMIGQPLSNLFPPQHSDKTHMLHKIAAAGGPTEYFEADLLRKDGALVSVSMTLSPVLDSAGAVAGVSSISRDITQWKQAEASLRQQNEYLKALHETALGLMGRLEVNELLESIVTRAAALANTEHGYLYLLAPNEQNMHLLVSVGAHFKNVGAPLKPGEGLSGKVWESGQTIAINDYQAWANRVMDNRYDRIQAALGMPIKSGSQVVGVFGLTYLEKGRQFGEREINLLDRFAQLASLALDNARLYRASQEEVAERKRAEQALRDSEKIFRQSIETAGAVPYRRDHRANRYTYMGEGIRNFLGYGPEEITPDLMGSLVAEEILRGESSGLMWYEAVQNAREGLLNVWRSDIRVKARDGQFRWLADASVEIKDETGKAIGSIGFLQDITERKQTEIALRDSQLRFQLAIEGVDDGLWDWDLIANQIYYAPRWKAILGYEDQELENTYAVFQQLVHPHDLPRIEQLTDDYLNHRISYYRAEIRMKHKDGHYIWVYRRGRALFYDEEVGQAYRFVGSHTDITERKQAEQALQESENRYRLQATYLQMAAEVARVVTSLLDLTQVLRRVTALLQERFGYQYAGIFLVEATGEWVVLQAVSGEVSSELKVGDLRLKKGGPTSVGYVAQTGQSRISQDLAQDNAYSYYTRMPNTRAAAVIPLFVGETIIGVLDVHSSEANTFTPEAISILTTLADQTAVAVHNASLHAAEKERAHELEHAYRALQENQAALLLTERMASLGRLTASLAHEMNTPLAAARMALAELARLVQEYESALGDPNLTRDDYQEISREMKQVIQLAGTATERATSFVRSIKAQTRDLAVHEREWFNAVQTIREALLLLGHTLKEWRCTATFEPDSEKIRLYGSPGRLAQLVTNLVTNAIDAYAGQNGTIHLQLSSRPIDTSLSPIPGAAYVELRIADQGSGIPPEILPKIFDPLFTTKPFGKGTGLGLTIVRDIVVNDFNGTIGVDSRFGQGTTFTFRFPLPSN